MKGEGRVGEMSYSQRLGLAKAMYTRGFYANSDGDYESTRGLANGVLGLQRETLDEAVKRALDIAESGWNPCAP